MNSYFYKNITILSATYQHIQHSVLESIPTLILELFCTAPHPSEPLLTHLFKVFKSNFLCGWDTLLRILRILMEPTHAWFSLPAPLLSSQVPSRARLREGVTHHLEWLLWSAVTRFRLRDLPPHLWHIQKPNLHWTRMYQAGLQTGALLVSLLSAGAFNYHSSSPAQTS